MAGLILASLFKLSNFAKGKLAGQLLSQPSNTEIFNSHVFEFELHLCINYRTLLDLELS